MTSYLSGGLASLDRWEGLKEWHRRHQDLLGEQSTSFQTEGFGNNCHSSMPNVVVKESHLKPKDSFLAHEGKENIVLAPDAAKHDLSIIQEADEDSRSKDGDLDGLKLYQGWSRGGRGESPETNEESSCKTQKSNNGNSRKTDGLFMNKREEQNNNCDKRVVKRPFLRKGKGLVRYNLKPDDLRHPYKNAPPNKTLSEKNSNLIRQGRLSGKPCVPNAVLGQSIAKKNLSYKKFAKAYDLTAPVQHLALQIPPQKFSGVEVGSWSQLFGADKDSSGKIDDDTSKALVLQKGETDTSTVSQKMRAKRVVNIMSAQNKVDLSIKQASSPEEDQDSLAAYLDLEQHVGNASFCSTSSKVDRLVAKSSEPTVCQSNPDAITQLKELTPTKTGRKIFNNVQGDCSFPESYYHMWSTSDLKNLIKSRALRSGSLMKANVEKNKAGNNHESNKTSPPKESRGVERNHSFTDPTQLEAPSVGWTVESLEARRKPHLMKTMSGIDLDSSLIKNALAPVLNPDISDSLFDSESSLSESSSDGEFDQNISESTEHPEIKESKLTGEDSIKCQVFKETQIAAQVPLQPTNNACLEELNIQIEARLSDLRKEIETLQAAKAKTQKYISSLEKKVQELEHRMALDARSFNKRLEDEREAAAKKLSEEQTKFLREKQSLQRTIRDERKKAPDPITQQELMRLKQEIAQWEEKWRADRAKARGLESNLRIQITNLKRENDKLKEETCKLQREKDTALSTAKARAASNTRVINSIAQQLGNTKPKVSVVREEIKEARKQTNRSAYNLKQSGQSKDSKNLNPVATIENFPEFPNRSNEWSTDEEIDLGKESSDDDVNELIKSSALYAEMLPTEPKLLQTKQHASTMETDQTNSITSLEETLAKYDAIFGNDKFDLIKEDMPGQRFTNSQVNQAWCKEKQPEMENFVKSVQHLDGKVEQIKENGTRVITYPDGTWKRHSSSGSVMTVPPSGWPVHISYFNGDQLEKLQDGTTRYFYAKTNVWQTTHPDGNEEMLYPSGQVERRDKDGTVKVLLPSVSSEPLHSSDNQPDGISIEKLHNGDTLILLPSGERELHTKEFMKKEFLDGSVKFLYNDGSQETHYPSGRIRVKDAQGNLIKDTSQSD